MLGAGLSPGELLIGPSSDPLKEMVTCMHLTETLAGQLPAAPSLEALLFEASEGKDAINFSHLLACKIGIHREERACRMAAQT